MDLFALGTPVMDVFAKAGKRQIAALGLKEGATNYFSARELAAIEKKVGKKVIHTYAGDNARNVCEGFAALGGFCGFQGTVGSDSGGAEFRASLLKCGIAPFLRQKRGSTGRILALVSPGGQRTFCADLGVSGDCRAMERAAFSKSKMFFVTSITLCCGLPVSRLAMQYLKACRKNGITAAISLESAPMVASHRKFLVSVVKKYADALFMNEEESRALLGKNAERVLAWLKPKVPIYLKKGRHGSHLYLHGRQQKIPALAARVVDSTGAGDAYAAGVLYGLTRAYTPAGSARIGCMLATKVVKKVGAGIPHAQTRIRIKHRK